MTTETKHTPGPWYGEPIEDDAIEVFGQTSGIQERIATVYAADGGANAHLIAAAPALLEVVAEVARQPCEMGQGIACIMVPSSTHADFEPCLPCHARQAIALAKGEQDA